MSSTLEWKGNVLCMHKLANGYEVASRKDVMFRDGNTRPDAANIICYVPEFLPGARTTFKLVVIKEFRPQINDWIWDLPAGKLDAGESVRECVERELKEETGLDLTQIVTVIEHTFPSVGMSDEQQALVSCFAKGDISTEFQEQHEDIKPFLVSASELRELANENALFGTQLATLILRDKEQL